MLIRYKMILLLFSVVLISSTTVDPHPVFRWDVKTLTDNSGINWTNELEKTKEGRLASIEGLTTKPTQFTSCNMPAKNTRRSDEKRVVKLKVRLVLVKKESNDNDYHIVIESLTNRNHQMVAEIPDPEDENLAPAKYASLRNRFKRLRDLVKTLLTSNVTTAPKKFPASTIVTIYGVPFWDCKHPGEVTGAAKDFREIHPVLEIEQ